MSLNFSVKENLNTSELYASLKEATRSLLEEEKDLIANVANVSSLLFHSLPKVNWVGFYFLKNEELVLGPFQGKLACTRIPLGKGVCGTAALKRQTIVVPDVDAFPGHIACDSASRSEVVVPLISQGKVWGVLDVDSPEAGRFTEEDARGLEAIVECVNASYEGAQTI